MCRRIVLLTITVRIRQRKDESDDDEDDSSDEVAVAEDVEFEDTGDKYKDDEELFDMLDVVDVSSFEITDSAGLVKADDPNTTNFSSGLLFISN